MHLHNLTCTGFFFKVNYFLFQVITETNAHLRSMNRGTNQSDRSKALSMEKELAITVTIIIGKII